MTKIYDKSGNVLFECESDNERDESFRYSYFLIDNLKNAINSVDFKKDYSNL